MSQLLNLESENSPLKKASLVFKDDNMGDFELAFRELTTELAMKINETDKLKLELEELRHENYELSGQLEKLKKTSEEFTYSFGILKQNSQDLEKKYYQKRDALTKLQLQYKIEASKNNSLREDWQKMTVEKADLIRKLAAFEEKQRHDLNYIHKITQKLGQLKIAQEMIQGDVQKVKEDMTCMNTLTKSIDLAQDNEKKFEELYDIIQNLKTEKSILEQENIKYKAKAEKLEFYVIGNEPLLKETNLAAKVFLNQCQRTSENLRQQIVMQNDMIQHLTEKLGKENKANLKLLTTNEIKEQELTVLKEKIRKLQKSRNSLELWISDSESE
ncbi:hypothetical protein ABEB36_013136 [Hypothenemus hampei]|uniref:Cilia- and flagella-associated protein 157 n=2 Tax=Hypothenemus hampei TaxID=57062 RepID=A0ABD1E6Y7_HYPHA